MSVRYVPEGHNCVCPYLTVRNAQDVIDFVKATFDAEIVQAMPGPGGVVVHAEVRIADSIVMIGSSPGEGATMPGQVHCYVPDADATYERAVRAGAASVRVPTDMFYGDRIAMVKDTSGIVWAISTHKEDVSPDEMARRMAQAKH